MTVGAVDITVIFQSEGKTIERHEHSILLTSMYSEILLLAKKVRKYRLLFEKQYAQTKKLWLCYEGG